MVTIIVALMLTYASIFLYIVSALCYFVTCAFHATAPSFFGAIRRPRDPLYALVHRGFTACVKTPIAAWIEWTVVMACLVIIECSIAYFISAHLVITRDI